MNTAHTQWLSETDRMTESALIRMTDWERAYLRLAMKRQVEETLNEALLSRDVAHHEVRVPTPERKGNETRDGDGVPPRMGDVDSETMESVR
ncbi:MAG: hypothetical protein Kow00105_15920 [Phycisphaeraceae bacterium]